jgi:hypothetical protein
MPALEADHDVCLLRQPVDNLAFSLVTPLGADDNDVRHLEMLLSLHLFLVIARLDRAIQYPDASESSNRRLGLLDAPLSRGMTAERGYPTAPGARAPRLVRG